VIVELAHYFWESMLQEVDPGMVGVIDWREYPAASRFPKVVHANCALEIRRSIAKLRRFALSIGMPDPPAQDDRCLKQKKLDDYFSN
jgi:hypothetical protein